MNALPPAPTHREGELADSPEELCGSACEEWSVPPEELASFKARRSAIP